jgi:hypothetical protein
MLMLAAIRSLPLSLLLLLAAHSATFLAASTASVLMVPPATHPSHTLCIASAAKGAVMAGGTDFRSMASKAGMGPASDEGAWALDVRFVD